MSLYDQMVMSSSMAASSSSSSSNSTMAHSFSDGLFWPARGPTVGLGPAGTEGSGTDGLNLPAEEWTCSSHYSGTTSSTWSNDGDKKRRM